MRKQTAIKICSEWHHGQWSALYQFASSGIYTIENHLRYLQEIETCLHPEYNLYPGFLNKKDSGNLERLKQFFILQGQTDGIYTQYKEHPVYGYLIPFIAGWVNESICEKVKALHYAI